MAQVDWKNEPGLRAYSAFLRAHTSVVRRIEADLSRGAQLPLGWYDVLLEVNAGPERRLKMAELGERAVLSRSRVSRIVDELVAAGMVERQANPQDKRSAYAAITPAGRQTLRRAAPVYLAAVREHFVAALSPEQVEVLGAAMQSLLDREG